MINKLQATIVLLLISSSAIAGSLDGCNLLSREDLDELEVPIGAVASPKWSEKDQLQLCQYDVGDSFKMMVAFGKPPSETIQKLKGTMDQIKNAPAKDVRPGSKGAFNESGFCAINTTPQGQILSCWEVTKDTAFTVVIIRSAATEPMKVSASSLLQTFGNIFSKLSQ